MNHREATEHLVDFVADRLDREIRDAVAFHAARCDDCRAWLETHDLLASDLHVLPRDQHPSSELLALCAVRSEEEFEPDRVDLRDHLEACDRCRHEVELVRAAVLDARPVPESTPAPATSRHLIPRWSYAVAAGLAAVAIGTLLVSGFWQGRTDDDRAREVASTAGEAPFEEGSAAHTEQFSEAEIEGTRLIETQGGLMISHTRIKDGAHVTIRAGASVAFGNGFQIGQQARIAVGGGPSDSAPEPRQAQNG